MPRANFNNLLGAARHFIFLAGRPQKTLFTIVGPRKRPVVLEDQGSGLLLVGNFALSTNDKLCRAVKSKSQALSACSRLPATFAFSATFGRVRPSAVPLDM